MSNANSAFGGDITYDGVQYPRLKMKQYGELEQQLREFRRSTLSAVLDSQRVAGKERIEAMTSAETKPISWIDVDDWLMTYDGARKAVIASMKLAGKSETEATEHAENLSMLAATQIARLCLGTLEVRTQNPQQADSQPNETGSANA